MENQELAEIDAAARAIVRRAYDLGRGEALKRVVEVLSSDRPSADQLALKGPEETPPVQYAALNGAATPKKRPWWAWPVR